MVNPGKIVLIAAFTVLAALPVFSQSDVFSDANVDYSFTLPDSGWKMTVKPSSTSPNVEYVYNERHQGLLEIRKLPVGNTASISDVIREEETKLQFRPGYVAGKEESFTGNLKGGIFNYEFIQAGRNMGGRFYFLRANDSTVYVLRFTGERDKLKSLRNQTDSIARTFRIK